MTNHADSPRAERGAFAAAFPAVAERHDLAIRSLGKAFDDFRPLAVLVGEGTLETRHVLRRFLQSLEDDVTAVRIDAVYPDVDSGLRAITKALGFDPSGLSVSDMYSILRLYLENQREHHRRTVVAVEDVDGQKRWNGTG